MYLRGVISNPGTSMCTPYCKGVGVAGPIFSRHPNSLPIEPQCSLSLAHSHSIAIDRTKNSSKTKDTCMRCWRVVRIMCNSVGGCWFGWKLVCAVVVRWEYVRIARLICSIFSRTFARIRWVFAMYFKWNAKVQSRDCFSGCFLKRKDSIAIVIVVFLFV
jgi:hypothetical protein